MFDVTVNDNLYMIMSSSASNTESEKSTEDSRTDLDSHANMPVVGGNCYVFRRTGRKATVSAFSPDYAPLDLEVVDAALMY